MTSRLTKIAVATLVLFCVGMIAGAVAITSSRKPANEIQAQQKQKPTTEIKSVSKSRIAVHRSSLALEQINTVESIPYDGGQILESDSAFDPHSFTTGSDETNSVQFLTRE
jgi:hypothetical protein